MLPLFLYFMPIIDKLMSWLATKLKWNMPSNDNIVEISLTLSTSEKIYQEAKSSLGKHMTLNDSIPAEVGCSEAICAILKNVGISVPTNGIPGTANLAEWLKNNPNFGSIDTIHSELGRGTIIVSPTGQGNGSVRGHTGILGDYGILSNDSQSGLFLELWTLDKWNQFYGKQGGLPILLFEAK